MKIYENECGIFYADKDGKLLRYVIKRTHLWRKKPYPTVYELNIPEGIRELPEGAFSGYELRRLVIPSSMEKLGKGVFSGSYVGEILLTDPEHTSPELLRQLGRRMRFAFFWNRDKLTRLCGRDTVTIDPDEENLLDAMVKGLQELRSISGRFWVDSDGMLVYYRLNDIDFWDENNVVPKLHIPEGVEGITEDSFQNLRVEELVLPQSLRYVGCCAFANSTLPDVVLTDNLEILDCYAFGHCTIRSLTVTPGFGKKYLPVFARQFKDCRVTEYRFPAEYRELLTKCLSGEPGLEYYEMTDPKHGRLFCVRVVEDQMGWGHECMKMGWGNEIIELIRRIIDENR